MSAINLLDLFEISSTLYKPTSIEKAEFPAGNDPEKNNKKKIVKDFIEEILIYQDTKKHEPWN